MNTCFCQLFFFKKTSTGNPGIFRNSVNDTGWSTDPCARRRESDESRTIFFGLLQNALFFRFAVKQIISSLIEQAMYISSLLNICKQILQPLSGIWICLHTMLFLGGRYLLMFEAFLQVE